MLTGFKRLVGRLRRDASGNAMMLVALGMPALIGGAGLAVDTAQWYMWKRELQHAADQAAIAGAWSRAKDDSGNTYQARATRELEQNLAVVDFAGTPSVALADYAGGTNNSVVVEVEATRTLPFSSFLTGEGATVAVRAQASFEPGETYTSCIIAVDDDDSGAITIGGNATLHSSCGMAALSNSPTAVIVHGSPSVDVGYILSAGGIDDWFNTNTDDAVHENLTGMVDPFAALVPPANSTPRAYGCSSGATNTTATTTVTTRPTTRVYTGRQLNNLTLQSTTTGSSNTTTTNNATVPNGTTAGTTTTSSTSSNTTSSGNGSNRTYTRTDVTTSTTTTYSNVVVAVTPPGAFMQPGTYTSFVTRCDTVMNPGIYVINGGNFEVRAQDVVTGNGVMIVLRNGAGIRINGGANINLTAMTASQLIAIGQTASNANQLAGMLIFEDRNSAGNSGNMINGNAATILNGTVYLPRSNLTFAGTAGVTSQCLLLAARTITIQGTADMLTFCPSGMEIERIVATTTDSVKLVS